MTTERRTERPDTLKLHRRATRRLILLPFIGGVLLIIVLTAITVLAGRSPTRAVADALLTVLMLCPLALCLLPLYLLLVIALVGMNHAHDLIAKPLRQLELLTEQLRDRTQSVSDRTARTSINLNARFAPLDRLIFSFFDRPAPSEDDHE